MRERERERAHLSPKGLVEASQQLHNLLGEVKLKLWYLDHNPLVSGGTEAGDLQRARRGDLNMAT